MLGFLAALTTGVAVWLFAKEGYALASAWLLARAGESGTMVSESVEELEWGWTDDRIRRTVLGGQIAVIVVAITVLVLFQSPVFAAFAAFLVYKAPLWFLQEQKIARMQRFEEQLPEAVNVMVASVRAGNSLITAIQEVADKIPGPVAREFKTIVREHLSAGIGLEEALSRARDRLPVESFAMISSALIINSSQGGDLLKILERMASAIRELDRLRKKIITETTEVRSQEKVILVMTPAFGILVCFFDPGIPDILFHSFSGNFLVVVVAAIQIGCVAWIRRIVRTSV